MSDPFCIDWFGGPSAQLEIFSAQAAQYQLKYTPAFRTTIRPPLVTLSLGTPDLKPINDELDRVAQGTAAARHGGNPAAIPAAADLEESLRLAGQQLFYLVVPRYVELDLRGRELALEIGVDERAPVTEIYGEQVIETLVAGTERFDRWGFAEGYGALVASLYESLVVPQTLSDVLNEGLAPEAAAERLEQEASEQLEALPG